MLARLADNKTSASGRRDSVSEGLAREPSSLIFSPSSVDMQASTGTFGSAMMKVEEREPLVGEDVVGRAIVASALSLSLVAARSPTFC